MSPILKNTFSILLVIVFQEVTQKPKETYGFDGLLTQQENKDIEGGGWIIPDIVKAKKGQRESLLNDRRGRVWKTPEGDLFQENVGTSRYGSEAGHRLSIKDTSYVNGGPRVLDKKSRFERGLEPTSLRDGKQRDIYTTADVLENTEDRYLGPKDFGVTGTDSEITLEKYTVEEGCVPFQEIWPCSCETDDYGDVTILCYGAQGTDMIHRALIPDYPSPNMKSLRILESNTGQLPEDILHSKTFREMDLYGSGITSIEPGAFDGCHRTLELIRLQSNHLKNFTFEELPNFKHLTFLALGDNQLTSMDGLVGLPPMPMQTLFMDGNHIASLHPDVFQSLPNLTGVDLSFNDIDAIPPGVFFPLTQLETLNLKGNNINHLSTGSFWLSTPVLRTMNLQKMELRGLDADVFRGVDIESQISLDVNHLRHLKHDTFWSLLHNISLGFGWLSVSGNWLTCDCDVLWILENEQMMSRLFSAACRNLTYLDDLNYDVLADECSTDPMWNIEGEIGV